MPTKRLDSYGQGVFFLGLCGMMFAQKWSELTPDCPMKPLFTGLLCLCYWLCSFYSIGQSALQWQKSMGGQNNEYAYASTPTADGGFVIVGSTNSNNNGDVPASKAFAGTGGTDIWVVKVNNWGEIVWSKTFGGSKDDIATDVVETKDKGILVLASTTSTDGDAQGNGSRGGLLLLKLKTDGSIQWRKIFAGGSTVGEIAFTKADAYSKPSIKATTDGNYIIAATIMPLISTDLWLAKIRDTGDILWTKTYGSRQNDWINEVFTCADGGYLLVGGTEANANELPGTGKGFIDVYILKVDAIGNVAWQKAWGGSNLDEASSAIQLPDGSFMIVGETNSTNGDFVQNIGAKDAFILKLSNNGTLVWKKQVGGLNSDGLYAIRRSTLGKFYAFGQSNSTFGTVKPKSSVGDVWITQIDDANGNLNENILFGGADIDIARGASSSTDGGFIIAANANSVDGDLTANNGGTDFWLLKTGIPFPVTIGSFSASLTNEQHVKLTWTSFNETRAKNFVVERSFDQIYFTRLGSVNASGTSTSSKTYSLTDAKPIFGKTYYRLKFYDDTNKEYIYKTVSAIVSLLPTENQLSAIQSVFPNPVVDNSFYVKADDNTLENLQLIDSKGYRQAIETEQQDALQTKVSAKQKLNAGIYFLIWENNRNKIVKKLIVP